MESGSGTAMLICSRERAVRRLRLTYLSTAVSIERERRLGGPRIFISSNFDLKWFEIAVEHERAALAARERAVAATDGSSEMGQAFNDEQKAAMVTIAASAFALDALYVKLNDLLDPASRSPAKENRIGQIVETFKLALDLGKRTQEFQASVPALFKLRDEALHFQAKPNEPQMHPTGKSNVALEAIVYRAERATEAIDLALQILTIAYSSPRVTHRAVVEWAKANAHLPDWLAETRVRRAANE